MVFHQVNRFAHQVEAGDPADNDIGELRQYFYTNVSNLHFHAGIR